MQWMTAASGIVHEEFHGRDFAQRGGLFEMVQLWVNLPAKYKMLPPRYQNILNDQIPVVKLQNGQGTARIIAGEFEEAAGPAHTFSPIHVWDLHLTSEQQVDLPVPEAFNTLLAVLKGTVMINHAETIGAAEVGIFYSAGDHLCISNAQNATVLLLCGEPIVGSGPFVMNTDAEIQSGKGRLSKWQDGTLNVLSILPDDMDAWFCTRFFNLFCQSTAIGNIYVNKTIKYNRRFRDDAVLLLMDHQARLISLAQAFRPLNLRIMY